MKSILILIIVLFVQIESYSQNSINKSVFSAFSVGLYGGFSTKEFQEMDVSGLFEVETNISKNMFINISIGHYLFNLIETTNTVKYRITPISIGAKYFIAIGHSSPYVNIESGCNFYNDPFSISSSKKRQTYFTGVGFGIYYNHTRNIKLDIRYSYKINSELENINNIIVGVLYSF